MTPIYGSKTHKYTLLQPMLWQSRRNVLYINLIRICQKRTAGDFTGTQRKYCKAFNSLTAENGNGNSNLITEGKYTIITYGYLRYRKLKGVETDYYLRLFYTKKK
jgi:hypothetical protein